MKTFKNSSCVNICCRSSSHFTIQKKLSPDEAMITRAVLEISNIQSMNIQFGMWVQNSVGMII